jgi:hypothetical protein
VKYEILEGQHVYLPEDSFECRLVFHILQQKLELQVPYFVDRDREMCESCRSGAWFAWGFYLPWPRPSGEQNFSLLVDVALPVNFWDARDPFVRWGTICDGGQPQQDEADLLALLRDKVNGRLRVLKPDRIFDYLRWLKKAV